MEEEHHFPKLPLKRHMLLLMAEILHQLRLVVYLIIYKVLLHPCRISSISSSSQLQIGGSILDDDKPYSKKWWFINQPYKRMVAPDFQG